MSLRVVLFFVRVGHQRRPWMEVFGSILTELTQGMVMMKVVTIPT